MASNPPPSEGSESSFWASVYQPGSPTTLSGVLTDLNLHRFTLHQHLSTHRALTETPLLHPPFQEAMPEAMQQHLRLYTASFQQIDVHVRRALTALDALGRHPPRVYFQDTDSTFDDDSASEVLLPTADDLLPGRTIQLPRITRHTIGTTSPAPSTFQHCSVQTPSVHFHHQSTQTDTLTLLMHEEQQTTPQPEPWSTAIQTDSLTSHATAQTELHSIVLSPAFATPTPLPTTATPTTTTGCTQTTTAAPPPADAPSLSNKQPNTDPLQWQYANFIPTPQVDQIPPAAGPADFTSPIGGTPGTHGQKLPRVRPPHSALGSARADPPHTLMPATAPQCQNPAPLHPTLFCLNHHNRHPCNRHQPTMHRRRQLHRLALIIPHRHLQFSFRMYSPQLQHPCRPLPTPGRHHIHNQNRHRHPFTTPSSHSNPALARSNTTTLPLPSHLKAIYRSARRTMTPTTTPGTTLGPMNSPSESSRLSTQPFHPHHGKRSLRHRET